MGAEKGKTTSCTDGLVAVNRAICRLYNRARINLIYLLLSPQEREWLVQMVAERTGRVWRICPVRSGVRIIE
jgi:hypothetical protein